MSEGWKLLLSLSLSGGLLTLLILAMKPFIRHRVSKTFQYYIWLLVLLRLVLPFSPESSLMNVLFYSAGSSGTIASGLQGSDPLMTMQNPAVPNLPGRKEAEKSSLSSLTVQQKVKEGYYNGDADHEAYLNDLLIQALLISWAIGVIVSLVYYTSGYLVFLRRLKSSNMPADSLESELLQKLAAEFSVRRDGVVLYRNRFSSTPMLTGLFRPAIIVPDMPFTQAQLGCILRHELTHLARRDILFKWAVVFVSALHWFNPLMFLLKREVNRACELSCDERVIGKLDRDSRQVYGETLIAVVAGLKFPAGILSTTMCEEKKTLKERLNAILDYRNRSMKTILSAAAIIIVLFGAAALLGAGVGRAPAGNSGTGTDASATSTNSVQQKGTAGSSSDSPLNPSDSGGTSHSYGALTGSLLSSKNYDLEEIVRHKTAYVGNNSRDLALVASLPLPDTFFRQQYISLGTKQKPYGLTAYYEAAGQEPYPGEWPISTPGAALEVNSKLNALVLFAMIGNVDEITFAYRGTQSTGQLEQDTYGNVFQYSRKEVESQWGTLTPLAEDPVKLADLIDRAAARWSTYISSPETPEQIADKIDKLLSAITDSPIASSNPGDFVRAHQKEYDDILKLGDSALPHLQEILASGDKGLRGRIAELLYKELKGSSETSGSALNTLPGVVADDSLSEFSKVEVAAARAVVEEFYRAIAGKDSQAVLATLYPKEGMIPEREKDGYELSFKEVDRTLVSMTFDSQDPVRKSYRPSNLPISAEDIIVFKTNFDIHYHGEPDGSWNEGRYDNWNMILVRDNPKSHWLIYDQGY